ncbi:MAG: hydrogenase iron-sulfur subunit [Candidatus Odinarchaeota archaeon]
MGENVGEYEPKILAFVCNWCSLGGCDAAGLARLSQPTNVRIIRVMCSGRIDPAFVFRAFSKGIDGVLVTGCHPNDCHYLTGNFKTEKRYEYLETLLQDIGLEPERLRLEWVSASEGNKWAETVNDFVAAVKRVGKSPFKLFLEQQETKALAVTEIQE